MQYSFRTEKQKREGKKARNQGLEVLITRRTLLRPCLLIKTEILFSDCRFLSWWLCHSVGRAAV